MLLTLSVDLKGIFNLGPKALIMFLAGTLGIVIGGPLSIIIISFFNPDLVGGAGPEAVWRGLSTVAGSWIGGGANQAGMLEIFGPSDELFSAMVTVDVLIANVWLAFLLFGAGIAPKIDRIFKGDTSAIEQLREKVENYQLSIAKIPKLPDIAVILALGFGMTAIAHLGADNITPYIEANFPMLERLSLTSHFFWLIAIATALGVGLSFTKASDYEGAGASKIGSMCLYVLVATIGMRMDILAIFNNPGFFLIGFIWMLFHVAILLSVAKLIKAPFFFVAVGSQANVGGAASAPIVASAFHPALAPVGVLLAVVGYAVGTYAAWFCGILMSVVAP